MNKKFLLIFALFILAFALNFVSSEEGCCVKVNNGPWCATADVTQCDSNFPINTATSCDFVLPFCARGTCVNENTGTCTANSRNASCIFEGGYLDMRSKSEIPQCQKGCCMLGSSTAFLTFVDCKSISLTYGIPLDFREGYTESQCTESANPQAEGACVIENPDESKSCIMTSKQNCPNSDTKHFNEGFLCTAPFLETDCVKSQETTCINGKVYFTFKCGARTEIGNIYDSSKFDNQDYWTKIQEPTCSVSNPSSTCGNCNEIEGTICREYKSGTYDMPNSAPSPGDYVCAGMGCGYDTDSDGNIENVEHYKHRERWCAMTPGTYFVNSSSTDKSKFHGILINPNTLNYTDSLFLKELNINNEKYNIPGAEYYQLSCVDGEVIVNPCETLRREVCMEYLYGENEEFRGSECVLNNYQSCPLNTNITECEKVPQFCKWVEGYRFDGSKVTSNTEIRGDIQGSCVPLFAPGFLFWEENTDPEREINGVQTCAITGITEATQYQLSWTNSRENFADNDLCKTSGDNHELDLVGRCIENCYLLPTYGTYSPVDPTNLFVPSPVFPRSIYSGILNSIIYNLHIGGKTPDDDENFENYCISDRQKYYCDVDSGEVGGSDADCAKGDNLPLRKYFPTFFTHNTFLNSIRERARSMGDCGYKASISSNLTETNSELELIKVYFRKLKHDGEPFDEGGTNIIYKGNTFVGWSN